MRRLALLVTTAFALLAMQTPARAMIAVDRLRPPLRDAAHAAATCPDLPAGRYTVHLQIDGAGRGHDASLSASPEGVSPNARRCVLDAFEAQSYGAVASGRVGGIQVNYPFVITAPPPT